MRLSFVIPSHNAAAWLPQAVSSVLEQQYKDFECVIVDDGSTDSTPDYLDWIAKDKRVKVIRNARNMGRSYSRNIGNKESSGDVICVLDADDLAVPMRAKIVAGRFDSGCEYLYGSALGMDACGRNIGEIKADVFNKDRAMETFENKIVHSSVAYSRSFAQRFPYSDGDIARLGLDDWEQQTRAYMAGVKLDFVPNVLCAYRVLDAAVTQTRSAEEVKKFKAGYMEAMKATA